MSQSLTNDPNFASRDFYNEVYTGFWINHIHGPFYGATLTLNRQQGSLLISFLALFVGTAGKSFWKVMRYGLHHMYSSRKVTAGIHHQRQVVLCDTPSALDAALSLINIGWAWRKRTTQLAWRIFPSLIMALVASVGFTLAGIFSSRVTFHNSNEVLLAGRNCRVTTDMDSIDSTKSYAGIKLNECFIYALQCYQQQLPRPSEICQTYSRSRLPYKVVINASCPFSSDVCLYQDKNIILDTGLLDSKDFGINGVQYFKFRMVRHCAPLVTDGHTIPSSSNILGANTPLYNYSKDSDRESMYQVPIFPINGTADTIQEWILASGQGYKVKVLRAVNVEQDNYVPLIPGKTFVPSPQIHRTDASVALLFLSAPGVLYDHEVTDPWFSARTRIDDFILRAITGLTAANNDMAFYISDQPATVLGCTRQQFYCNPDLPGDQQCMIFEAENEIDLGSISRLWPDPVQSAYMNGVIRSLSHYYLTSDSDISYEIAGLPSVLARFGQAKSGPSLDIDGEQQWQREMELTFQANLAILQSSLVDAAKGFFPLQQYPYEQEEGYKLVCTSQKFRSPHHYSFSVLGVSIIFVVGGTIMLIGAFIEELVSAYSMLRKSSPSYAQVEWQTNSMLQLQRLAHEGVGVKTWSKVLDTVPVTEKDVMLGVLDVSNSKHPRLIHPEA